jgi:hypothetical protein
MDADDDACLEDTGIIRVEIEQLKSRRPES